MAWRRCLGVLLVMLIVLVVIGLTLNVDAGHQMSSAQVAVFQTKSTKVAVFQTKSTRPESDCVPAGMRAVPVLGGAFKMVVLGDNDIVSASLAHKGAWEVKSPEEIGSKANTNLPANGSMLEIGANIGYYTLMFANRGYNVVAVEPMTRNRKAIEGSLCLNPHLRSLVTVVPAALVAPDEAEGARCIVKSTNYAINIGNGHLICSREANFQGCSSGDMNCEEVPVKMLDQVLSDVAPSSIEFVKVDVEGYECNVLKGATKLFKAYQPQLLQVETQYGGAGACVDAAAREYGYTLVRDGADTRMVRRRTSLLKSQ